MKERMKTTIGDYTIQLDSMETTPMRTGFSGRLEWKWTLYYKGEWAGCSPWLLASKKSVYKRALDVIEQREKKR